MCYQYPLKPWQSRGRGGVGDDSSQCELEGRSSSIPIILKVPEWISVKSRRTIIKITLRMHLDKIAKGPSVSGTKSCRIDCSPAAFHHVYVQGAVQYSEVYCTQCTSPTSTPLPGFGRLIFIAVSPPPMFWIIKVNQAAGWPLLDMAQHFTWGPSTYTLPLAHF